MRGGRKGSETSLQVANCLKSLGAKTAINVMTMSGVDESCSCHCYYSSSVLAGLLPSALMRSAGSACQRFSMIWTSSEPYSRLIITVRSGRWLSTLAACATVFCGRFANGFSPAQKRQKE